MRTTPLYCLLLSRTTARSSKALSSSSQLRRVHRGVQEQQEEEPGRNRNTAVSCTTPSFVGAWESLADYPFSTIEAQGGFVGDDFVITGGFYPDSSSATVQTWAYQTGQWERRADYPIPAGVTHAAIAVEKDDVDGDKLYVCGGYVGGNPGPATAKCYVYRSTTNVWSALPDLPAPRGGGGLVYRRSSNSLLFATGAVRTGQDSVDYANAWTLDLASSSTSAAAAWTPVADSLLVGNHIASVTGVDGDGVEHYYILGGQKGENEETGNVDIVTEYMTGTWTNRAPMTMKRGHANAATIPYRCGLIIAGGAINGTAAPSLFGHIWNFVMGILDALFGIKKKAQSVSSSSTATGGASTTQKIFGNAVGRATTADISYYDIVTDAWTTIGQLPSPVKTAVCDIKDDYLYCGTGGNNDFWRRKFVTVAV
jgi:gamma-glutamylcyclotransferase (GGCT)/AIG2-like uncharacterized protein YtfP